MFDSHAHYDDRAFDEDREAVIRRMFDEGGVEGIINAGCDIRTSLLALDIARLDRRIYTTAGIHPENAADVEADWEEKLVEILQNKKVVAIGEIGLDYHYDTPSREVQKEIFLRQMQLASRLKMPVVIHDRDAHGDCLDIVSKFPDVKGVFHSFSGSVEMAEILMKKGWYISVGGVVTFKNARQLPEVVSAVPLERIMIETDAPYLAPVPFRGKRNTSDLMRFTLEKIASIKGITFEEAERITTQNTLQFFGMDDFA